MTTAVTILTMQLQGALLLFMLFGLWRVSGDSEQTREEAKNGQVFDHKA